MSSVYYTGPRNNPKNGALREYKDGLVVQVSYPTNYTGGKKRTAEEINRKEGKLKAADKNGPFIDDSEYSDELSLSTIWKDYSMYIISLFVLIASIIIFFVYKKMNAAKIV
jgi:hypothetical protein